MVSRLPRAPAGTRRKQRAIEFSHTSRMFRNRLPMVQTLQRIDPGAGANSTRATSRRPRRPRRGVTESTSMRTSPEARPAPMTKRRCRSQQHRGQRGEPADHAIQTTLLRVRAPARRLRAATRRVRHAVGNDVYNARVIPGVSQSSPPTAFASVAAIARTPRSPRSRTSHDQSVVCDEQRVVSPPVSRSAASTPARRPRGVRGTPRGARARSATGSRRVASRSAGTLACPPVAQRTEKQTQNTRLRRRRPRLSELRPLVGFDLPGRKFTERRLAAALTIRTCACSRSAGRCGPRSTTRTGRLRGNVPGAGVSRSTTSFHPQVLRDVSLVDTSVGVLGGRSALPFGIAPTGFTRLMRTEGERAGAAAVERPGSPLALHARNRVGRRGRRGEPNRPKLVPALHVEGPRPVARELVRRAADAGFDTLLVTVDVPVAGARLRDRRNGMTIPPGSRSPPCWTRSGGRHGGSTS